MSRSDLPSDARPAPRVLVLEPFPFLAYRLARLAASCGAAVVEVAPSAADAVGRLRHGGFDVVLAGVDRLTWPALPELAAVRDAAPGAVLVALSDAPEPEVVRACRARGAEIVLDLRVQGFLLSAFLRDLCEPPA